MATPTTTFHGPGPGNVFIPAFGGQVPGATGQIQVEFSRNPARFNVNRYVQVIPDAAEKGLYLEIDTDEAVRIVNDQDYVWPDGDDAPDIGTRPMRWKKYSTIRRAYPFRLGQKTVQNAPWDVVATHARMSATQGMTNRTLQVVTEITTAANWPGDNKAATVDALLGTSGEDWFASSTTELTIQNSIHTVVEKILQTTGGAVQGDEILLVIGPDVAHKMSRTAELHDYMTAHEQAIQWLEQRGAGQGVVTGYNLPRWLYGVQIVVEDAVRVTTRHGASTTTRAFMMGNNAVFLSRPGGLVGPPATDSGTVAPTFSTVIVPTYEDMTVEQFEDPINRRIRGRVVDDFDVQIAAPASGFHIADVST